MSQGGLINPEKANPDIATHFVTDDGTAVPSANILQVLGGTNITTSGSGNVITIDTSALASAITTIAGDSGSATGSTVTFNALSNAGSSVRFVGDNASTIYLAVSDDFNNNTFIGNLSGNPAVPGTGNTGIGRGTLSSMTDPVFSSGNTALGSQALNQCTNQGDNTGIGYVSMQKLQSGNSNTAVGSGSLLNMTAGSNQISIGVLSFGNQPTGNSNIGIGNGVGGLYIGSETNNILIGHFMSGPPGENNTIRIGSLDTPQTRCFVQGIAGVSVSNTALVTVNTSNNQLGSTAIPLEIASGGTNATTIGAAGTFATSTGTAYSFTTATFPSTATTVGTILRANGTNWVASTSTFADTYAQYSILSAGTANTITGLATATRAVLCTKSTGEVFYVPLGSHQFVSRGTADDPEAWNFSPGTGILLLISDATNITTVSLITPVVIANGGTNTTAAIGASGTFAQSDGSKYTFTTATFPSTATSSGTILRANGTNWVASTSTFADTYTASNLLYSNGSNTVTGLATANSAQLVTNSSGVPAMTASLTNGQVVIGSTGATPVPGTIASSDLSITVTTGAGTLNLVTGTDNGSITWTNTAVTNFNITMAAGYVELDNVGSISYVLLGGGTNFQLSGTGKLQYIGASAKKFWVQGGVSHTTVGIAIQLYVNSTTPVGNIGYGAGADKTTMGLVTLQPNDYLSVWASRIGQSTINVPIHYMNVTATQA